MSIRIDKIARYLKIQQFYRSGKEVPTIRLAGRWITDLGFKVGETTTIHIRERLLIIEPAAETVKEALNDKATLQAVKKTLKALTP